MTSTDATIRPSMRLLTADVKVHSRHSLQQQTMPGIVLFGRRWRVASDDFVFSSFAEILLRITWLIVFAVIVDLETDETCPIKPELLGFYIGMLVVLSLSIIGCALTVFFSMQGTIANAHPRRHVAKVLVARLLLFLVELCFVAFGTYVAFGADTMHCSVAAIDAMRVFVVMMWIVIGFFLVGVSILFDPRGNPNLNDTELNSRDRKSWTRRLKCLFCCCINIRSDRTSDALDDIATLITDYLSGVDFVASDVTAGLLLVKEEQNRRKNSPQFASMPYSASPSASAVNSQDNEMNDLRHHPDDWMTIPTAHHFMNFAMGSYGWPLFIYGNLCTGVCRLTAGCKCCSCIRSSGGKEAAEGDNCCSCNASAITRQTGIPSEDIVYANFTNKIHQIPFYVAMDHVQEAVVVAIRGTLSVKDSITDMDAALEEMIVDGVSDAKAHKGILNSARYIETTIRSLRLLETAFSRNPGYRLVITGHSLGAGAAAILAVLLRPIFPQLICFAFSPPGWLLSLALSRHTESYVCSIVVGVDIIPRLGIATMEKLKDQMTKAINSCDRPKYQVLGRELLNTVLCCRKPSEQDTVDTINEYNFSPDVEANNQHIGVHCNNNYCESRVQHKLFLPGRVLYLHEVAPRRGCSGVPIYEVFWRKPESFDEILLNGKKMLSDHFPDVVLKALFSATQNSACAVSQSFEQCASRPASCSQPIVDMQTSRVSADDQQSMTN